MRPVRRPPEESFKLEVSNQAPCLEAINLPLCSFQLIAMQIAGILDSLRDRYAFPGATAAFVLPDYGMVTSTTALADLAIWTAHRGE